MAEKRNANFSIPDDRESSTYRFIIVAAKRARQLQNGARSFLPVVGWSRSRHLHHVARLRLCCL